MKKINIGDKTMNNFIKKNINLILCIFILLQPVLDLITGVGIHLLKSQVTVGIIVRILFLIFIMYTLIFVYKKKKLLLYYGIIFIYFCFYILGFYLYNRNVFLLGEIQGFIRVFYFPILLLSFYQIKDDINIPNKILFTTLVIYILLIFIPYITNTGYKTYEITKKGTLGFFNSANEISGIISILTPIIFIIYNSKKHLILKVIFSFIYGVVILMVGTKTPLLSLIISILTALIYIIVKLIKTKKYKAVFSLITIFAILSFSIVLIIPKTNFYKNIKTHLKFLKVDNIVDVFKDEKLIDHFIFSQRLSFEKKTKKLYKSSSSYQKLMGIGYLEKNSNKKLKQIEMDYYDIYYSQGILGFIIFFSCYIYILVDIFRNKIILNYENIMLILSVFLIIVLSLFSGHIITAPAVSIFVCVILLNLKKSCLNKKKAI